MRANEFVKNCGIDSAKSLLKMGSGYCDIMGYEFHTDDLKRLVESYELVEECGGLAKAKERVSHENGLPNPNVFYVLVVSSAIADVESCL